MRRRGNQITVITEAEKSRWVEATKPVIDTWLTQAQEKGLKAEELLADARALIAKHSEGSG